MIPNLSEHDLSRALSAVLGSNMWAPNLACLGPGTSRIVQKAHICPSPAVRGENGTSMTQYVLKMLVASCIPSASREASITANLMTSGPYKHSMGGASIAANFDWLHCNARCFYARRLRLASRFCLTAWLTWCQIRRTLSPDAREDIAQ